MHKIEKIKQFSPKEQGQMFITENLEQFAKERCEELNNLENSIEYGLRYEFKIMNRWERSGSVPYELYVESGEKGKRIEILRTFK